MTTPAVLHVTPQLSEGGAGRAATNVAAQCQRANIGRHAILSLRRASPPAIEQARRRGVDVHDAPDDRTVDELLSRADVVHLHFWNTPVTWELLRRPLPDLRLVVWAHVSGGFPPQVITPDLADLADRLVVSTPYSLEAWSDATLIEPFTDPARVTRPPRSETVRMTIGYVGSLDGVKVHPRFVELHVPLVRLGARVIVCGDGDQRRSMQTHADAVAPGGFEWRGHVADVGGALAEMDVFGYPLHPTVGEACELALQEAMLGGVPPVVLAAAGARHTVDDGVTGLVADDDEGYVAGATRLLTDDALRWRLGASARSVAATRWSPQRIVEQWRELYDAVLGEPKRSRRTTLRPAVGWEQFVAALGEAGAPFARSATAGDLAAALEADAEIAAGAPQLTGNADGGILHFAAAHPDEPLLHLWAGLALVGRGRPAMAAAEFRRAQVAGLDDGRAAWYQALAADAAGDETALARLVGTDLPTGARRPAWATHV